MNDQVIGRGTPRHDIKAIQTRYKGYHFRSRLEARWAVFFDACGEPWQYEPEGYDLSSRQSLSGQGKMLRRYLPDFWLPEISTWVEIKPCLPADCFAFTEEEALIYELVYLTQANEGHVFWGLPDLSTPSTSVALRRDIPFGKRFLPREPSREITGGLCNLSIRLSDEAVEAARSARFEHGERGRT